MPKDEFDKKVYEPVITLLEEQDIKMDVVFVKQKTDKKDYTEEEWAKFMNECFVTDYGDDYSDDYTKKSDDKYEDEDYKEDYEEDYKEEYEEDYKEDYDEKEIELSHDHGRKVLNMDSCNIRELIGAFKKYDNGTFYLTKEDYITAFESWLNRPDDISDELRNMQNRYIEFIFENYKTSDNRINLPNLIAGLSTWCENILQKKSHVFMLFTTEENKGKTGYKLSYENLIRLFGESFRMLMIFDKSIKEDYYDSARDIVNRIYEKDNIDKSNKITWNHIYNSVVNGDLKFTPPEVKSYKSQIGGDYLDLALHFNIGACFNSAVDILLKKGKKYNKYIFNSYQNMIKKDFTNHPSISNLFKTQTNRILVREGMIIIKDEIFKRLGGFHNYLWNIGDVFYEFERKAASYRGVWYDYDYNYTVNYITAPNFIFKSIRDKKYDDSLAYNEFILADYRDKMNDSVNLDYNETDKSYFILTNENASVKGDEDVDEDNEQQNTNNTIYNFDIKLTEMCNPLIIESLKTIPISTTYAPEYNPLDGNEYISGKIKEDVKFILEQYKLPGKFDISHRETTSPQINMLSDIGTGVDYDDKLSDSKSHYTPESPNIVPYSPDNEPESPNIVPYSPDNEPESPNIVPYSPGGIPYSPGGIPDSSGGIPYSPGGIPYSPGRVLENQPTMNNSEMQEAVAEYLSIVDEYYKLNYSDSKQLESIIEQFIQNGEDKGINEKEMADILMTRLKNKQTSAKSIQRGGNYNVYTISFTNLEYNSIYLFSKLNFIGYALTSILFRNYYKKFQYVLKYKLDGSDSCKIILFETEQDIKFKKYNITSAQRFYVDTRVLPSKSVDYNFSPEYTYKMRILKEKDAPITKSSDESYWKELLTKADKKHKDKQSKKLNQLLRDIDSYDGKISHLTDTDIDTENITEEHEESEDNISQFNRSANEIYSEVSRNSDILNLPNQFIQDDKVEINMDNIDFNERGLEIQKYAERKGHVIEALDNFYYKVDFDGEHVTLHEKEIKKHNPDVKKISIKDNKRLLSKNIISQPEKNDMNDMQNEMENEIDEMENEPVPEPEPEPVLDSEDIQNIKTEMNTEPHE